MYTLKINKMCFRPLSGIMFSIAPLSEDDEEKKVARFPSPLGDYVFNHFVKILEEERKKLFPSPLGDYVFNRRDDIV